MTRGLCGAKPASQWECQTMALQSPPQQTPCRPAEPQCQGRSGLHQSELKALSWAQAWRAGVRGRQMLLLRAGPLSGKASLSSCHVGLWGGTAEVRDPGLLRGPFLTSGISHCQCGRTLDPVSDSHPCVSRTSPCLVRWWPGHLLARVLQGSGPVPTLGFSGDPRACPCSVHTMWASAFPGLCPCAVMHTRAWS